MRGRIDHKDAEKTCLVVQAVEPFCPTPEQVQAAREAAARAAVGPLPVHVLLDATRLPASVIDELKHVFGNHAGESEVVLDIQTSAGPRTLRLGDGFRVKPTPSLRAELEHILGPAALRAQPA